MNHTTDLSKIVITEGYLVVLPWCGISNMKHIISEVRLNVEWALGIEIKTDDKKFVLINVYSRMNVPYNEAEFNRLASSSLRVFLSP